MKIESRPLSYPEDFFVFAHDQLCGYGISSTMVRFAGQIDPNSLKEAFKFLFFRHPLLRSKMVKEGEVHILKCDNTFENIPLAFFERESSEQWKEIIHHELGTLFNTSTNLWRGVILTSKDEVEMILTFHHAISDGVSRMNLYEELIYCYEELFQGRFPALQLLTLHQPSKELLKSCSFQNGKRPEIPSDGLTPWPFMQVAPLEDRSTGFVYKELPLDQCLAKGPAATLFLGAAMVMAAQRLLGQKINVILEVPINLRPFCDPPVEKDIYGCYVTIFETIFKGVSAESSIWDLVKTCAQQFEAPYPFLASNFDYSILENLEKEERKRQHFRKIGLINLGNFNLDEKKTSIRPISFFVASNQRVAVYAIGLYVVRINDKLCLTFNYSRPAMDSASAEYFVNAFLEQLLVEKSNSTVAT